MITSGNISAQPDTHARGLTSATAIDLLKRFGPNEVKERHESPWLALARKFWAPVPWMLEAAVFLTLILGRQEDAVIISFLLLFNAVLSYAQENRAGNALSLLRERLAVSTRVLRDGEWRLIPARELVPGDVVHVRVGDVVPADLRLLDGDLQLDQSALTGESLPRESVATETVYAGSTVQRGEATAEVAATGANTSFGKTTQLVQAARTATHLESTILTIVKYLMAVDVALVLGVLLYALGAQIPVVEVLPFALIILIASVPAALPATFTVAQALGAVEMARHGVLVTRLSAIEEAAMMDVLCTDKTGTITENRLSLGDMQVYPPFTPDQLLDLAALASDAASQDPIDLAILQARPTAGPSSGYSRLSYTPFDPATKRTEATVSKGGEELRVVKGMPEIVATMVAEASADLPLQMEALASKGARVLAVAVGSGGNLRLAGLLGLVDRPRPDSQDLIAQLVHLGVRVKMMTGDTVATALAIAKQVGIGLQVCDRREAQADTSEAASRCDIFPGVFPEEKFSLVQSLQQAGHVAGMTGDGVNDAPALKQAEVGIAVATATDVAKAAASMVLTTPGLVDVVSAIETSRRIYQRMLTYTLNKVIKTFQIALFLSVAFFLTRQFVVTPFLLVLLLFANDFATMSIATDHVGYSAKPDRWHIGSLVAAAGVLSLGALAESFLVLYLAKDLLGLPLPQVQTLVFTMLVFSGQASLYLVRVRRHFWTASPSRPLMIATLVDVTAVAILASQGLLMTAVPLPLVLAVLGVALLFMVLMDPGKVALFRRFNLI